MEKKLNWFRPAFTAIVLTLAGIFVIYLVYDMLFLPKLQISQRQVLHNYAYTTPYYICLLYTSTEAKAFVSCRRRLFLLEKSRKGQIT